MTTPLLPLQLSPALRELFPRSTTPMQGDVERASRLRGEHLIVGVDEAGRGPLAGPVTVGAVIFDATLLHEEDSPEAWWRELNDSKQLTEAQREALYDLILEHALAWRIVHYDHEAVDRLNILQATRAAMKEAVEGVLLDLAQPVDRVYIDGKQYIEVTTPQTAVIKGDARSYHIAAASILAKVSRDRFMVTCDERWPEYGFAQHKGYGTRQHRAAIASHGPCEVHRKTFGGVREHLAALEKTPSEQK